MSSSSLTGPKLTQAQILDLRRKAYLYVPFCPHTPHPKQSLFLSFETLPELMFGGSAGGGKSDVLLMAALQYVDIPGYAALILRRTFADLDLPGGILDRAREWLFNLPGVTWNEKGHKFTFSIPPSKDFPKGGESSLTFGYCEVENDKNRYRGSEFQYIGFDELTTFPESVYTFMFSRLRRKKSINVPLRMRSATNPGDIGHEWVKRRFITHNTKPDKRLFIPSFLPDNPSLNQEEYEQSLQELPESVRDQLLKGLWITDSGARVYKHNEKHLIPTLPAHPGEWRRAFVVDFGASEMKATTGFALVAWNDASPNIYIEECWKEPGMTPSLIAERFTEKLQQHGGDLICIADAGALGLSIVNELRIRYDIPVLAAEKKEKRTFRRLLNGSLEKYETFVVEPSCKDLIEEWENLIFSSNGLDEAKGLANHCSDAVLYGWRYSKALTTEYSPDVTPLYGTAAYWEMRTQKQVANERKQIREELQQEENIRFLID